jgi:hypothetical protein
MYAVYVSSYNIMTGEEILYSHFLATTPSLSQTELNSKS